MTQTKVLAGERQRSSPFQIRVFSPFIRTLWVTILVITILSEVIPMPLIPPVPFYLYKSAKVLCFIVVGYFAPLAFWRFNAFNRGILLAAISAACVESLQGLLHRGHSFHWYELVIKLGLIVLGFALALDARYDLQISIGPLHVRLTDSHLES
jgi:hypothetical protein